MTVFNPSKIFVAMSTLTVLAAAPAAFADAPLSTVSTQRSGHSNFIKLADSDPKTKRSRDKSHKDRGSRNRDRGHHRHRGYSNSRHHNYGGRHHYRGRHNYGGRHYERNYPRHYSAPIRYRQTRRHSSYSTPYRSHIGISFNLGTPHYSSHRWAPAAYSFYQPSYGSYSRYQSQTQCRRVTREAWHHGHRELISVKECSNPWSGTYTVQGSERLIDCRY